MEAVHEEARHTYACQKTLSEPNYTKLLPVQLQLIDEAEGEEPDDHQAESNAQNVIMPSTIEEPTDPHRKEESDEWLRPTDQTELGVGYGWG